MKNKGFTLVELLSIIVILAIIIAIAIPVVSALIENARINAYIIDQKMMIRATKNYMDYNNYILPQTIGSTTEIPLKTLQDQHFIDEIADPWNTSDLCSGYILITKEDANSYDYNPYLKCNSNYKANNYIEDGLVVSWELNNNAYDYTPNNYMGYINNVIGGTNRFDESNRALKFQGPSNFIDTNYDYSFNYNSGTTIIVWTKFSTIDTDGKIKDILGKNSWEYILSQIDNKIIFIQWNSVGEYATYLTSNININPNTWYNIAVVYNNVYKTFSLYINGVLDTYDKTTSTVFANNPETLKIGRGYPEEGAASSSFFIGNIDNITIYNRALSFHEIKLYYNVGLQID